MKRVHALPAMALAIALAALGAALWHSSDITARYAAQLDDQRALHAELNGLQHDRRILQQYLDAYHTLNASGAFHGEDRLAWIAAVEAAVAEHDLAHVRYTVFPQGPYAGPPLPHGQ